MMFLGLLTALRGLGLFRSDLERGLTRGAEGISK